MQVELVDDLLGEVGGGIGDDSEGHGGLLIGRGRRAAPELRWGHSSANWVRCTGCGQ